MPALIAALVAGRAARPKAGAMSGARKTPSAPPATTAAIVPFQLEAITLPFVFVSPMRTPKAVDRHRARRAEDLSARSANDELSDPVGVPNQWCGRTSAPSRAQ